MHYQWYPGHMSKAKRQIQDELKLVDVIVELVDARIPISSKNPDINKMAGNKPRVLLLNKADLADDAKTKEFKAHFEKQGYKVLPVNAKGGTGIKNVLAVIKDACKEKRERDAKKGIIGRPLRAMILGIPNVGKSTFINAFAGKNCTLVGNKPGVTKGKQWIRLNKELELLDTPGILWPKFEDQRVGLRIAWIGSINEDILDIRELAVTLLKYLYKTYPGVIAKKYGIEEAADGNEALERIARKRGCLIKGGEADLDRAANIVMDEFRAGKIGKITLETVRSESAPIITATEETTQIDAEKLLDSELGVESKQISDDESGADPEKEAVVKNDLPVKED